MIRRFIDRRIEAALARRYTPPQGANITPITQAVINQMQAQLAPQDKTQGMFSPGAPLKPVPGITPAQGPRQWQYPPAGYNIQHPRSTEVNSFDTLRNLAMLYDGIGMCKRVWFDLCSKPELQIKPRPRLTIDDNGDPIPQEKIMSRYGARIAKWEDFFAKPDKKRSLKKWMRMALNETLDIDALASFKHRSRDGSLYALEIIDGSTIKPLADERGLSPVKPFPAYQQFVYGVPGMLILGDDMIYQRETERANSQYGLSRVEIILLRVNQALRKQNKDLSTFTDGNMPAGTLEPPDDGTTDWTPEQLLLYQEMWDGMLAGNDSIKARIKVIPPGSKFNKTDPDDIMTPFDLFLLNVTVGAFGLTMSELGFTETVNKSSGETQEAVIYRRAMSPLMDTFGEMFTDVMAAEGETDLYATWKAFEEPEDFKMKVDAWNILTSNGTQSTSQAATALGLKPMVETEPYVIVPGQGITFIKDAMDEKVRQAATDAKLAGYQQAQNPQEQQPGQGQQGDDGQQDEEDDQAAIDEAEKAFSGGGSQQRYDPVHAYHGEFGFTGTTPAKGGGHHKGSHHHKGKHPRHKYTTAQRMQRLAARFTKLEHSKHLDAKEKAAAGKIAGFFNQLAADITRGGQQQAIDALFDKIWAQAKILWSNKPRSLGAMARALTRLDAKNDAGKLRAMEAEDDIEAYLETVEDELDEQGTQEQQPNAQGSQGGGASQAQGDSGEPSEVGSAMDDSRTARSLDAALPGQSRDAERAEGSIDAQDTQMQNEANSSQSAQRAAQRAGAPVSTMANQDYRRWRERAIDDIRRGRAFRVFASEYIEATSRERIQSGLERCTTVEDVKRVFERAKQPWGDTAYVEQELAALRTQGSVIEWDINPQSSESGTCEICKPNHGVKRTIGEPFPSGHQIPPVHDHCECQVRVVK